ncbi:MAG: hypothetical protein F4Z82_22110 [Caldilineaceae bacterium SB0668_bin_21]|nr:hypothetical protein [Caldilineaceae bacterium SB0668_bin_21]
MKEVTPSSKYRTGPTLDERREWHWDFIEKHLVLQQGFETESTKVSRRYGKWLGVRNWSSWDVRNLYIGLVQEHDVRIKGNTLIGVGLRD